MISEENQVCLSLILDPRSTSYSCLRRRVRVCAFHSNISRIWRSPTIPHFHAVRWKVHDIRRRSGRCCGNVDLSVAEAFCDLWGPSSGRATRRSLRDSIDVKKDHSPFGEGEEGVAKTARNPASGAVRWPGFLDSDWFQKGKNYSANTTIISCLATAHQSRGTTQAASPRVCISNFRGVLKKQSTLSAGPEALGPTQLNSRLGVQTNT